MGFRRFMFRGVTKVRDGTGPRLRRLEPAPAAGVGRSGGLARGPPARGTRSVTAQHGSGGAVGAPMRRRTGRSLPDPCPAAPNRSGDGVPAPVHGSLGSRSWASVADGKAIRSPLALIERSIQVGVPSRRD